MFSSIKNKKRFTLVLSAIFFSFIAIPAFSLTSGTVGLSGTNAPFLEFNFWPSGTAVNIAIDLDTTNDCDIDMIIKSNYKNWQITVISTNGGVLKHTTLPTETIRYELLLDTWFGFFDTVSGTITTQYHEITPKGGTVIHFGVYLAYDGFDDLVFEPGTYTDTLTVELGVL